MDSTENTLSPLQQSTTSGITFRLRRPQHAKPKACVATRMSGGLVI
jgi:hypothetical protein